MSIPIVKRKQSLFMVSVVVLGSVVLVAAIIAQLIRPVHAADPPVVNLNATISSDGTADFDIDDTAGNDSGPNNGIVRVNDLVEWELQFNIVDNPADRVFYAVTFPKGIKVNDIPAYCGAGSTLTPSDPGTPTLPLSATSNDELAEQTLVCELGPRTPGGSEFAPINTTALGYVPNGHVYSLVSASITAEYTDDDGNTQTVVNNDTTDLPEVTASSRLKWDLSKNSINDTPNSGYIQGGNTRVACPWDAAVYCMVRNYPILLGAPAGGKGAAPAIGDVTFRERLSARDFIPGLTEAQYLMIEADPVKYGIRGRAVVGNLNGDILPGYRVGASASQTEATAVRDSGMITLAGTQISGDPSHLYTDDITVTISGADLSLATYPSHAPTGTTTYNHAYAVSVYVTTYVPADLINDFGTGPVGDKTLQVRNEIDDLEVHGLGGAIQTGETRTNNNYRQHSLSVTFGGSLGKNFLPVPGRTLGNGATRDSGQIHVTPGETMISHLRSNSAGPGEGPLTMLFCDSWNNNELHLKRGSYRALQSSDLPLSDQWINWGVNNVRWASDYDGTERAVWPASHRINTGSSSWNGDIAQFPAYTIQYSGAVAPGAGTASACGDDKGPWYNNPEDVPGNDPALAAQGEYTAVNRVRINVHIPESPVGNPNANDTAIAFAIALKVPSDTSALTIGQRLDNYASAWWAEGHHTMAQMSSESVPIIRKTHSNYNQNTHAGTPSGDRVTLTLGSTSIAKEIRKGMTGPWTKSAPSTTGGDTVQFRLQPRFAVEGDASTYRDNIWVEDCMPGSLVYASATPMPTVVSVGSTPSDANRAACAAGETYVRWIFANHQVNTPIPEIVITSTVRGSALNGSYTNRVSVWAAGDAAPESQRNDTASFTISNLAAVRLEKTALTPITQVNRVEQTTNEELRWQLLLTNTSTTIINNADVIDVLPRAGTAGSAYQGGLTFKSATVVAGGVPGTQLLYTSDSSVELDPSHARNLAGGATAWCDAVSGGTVVSGIGGCPASASEVTGVRIVRPGAFGTGARLEAEVVLEGMGNRTDDVYVNRSTANATGLEFPAVALPSQETVIAATVGNTAFWDMNRNGVRDAGDVTAAGVTIRLTGVDDLGNNVDVTTTSAADGSYSFGNLRASGPAGYEIRFGLPAGADGYTTQRTGIDPSVDSDVNQQTGRITIHLMSGMTLENIDAGFLRSPDAGIPHVPGVPDAGIRPATFWVVGASVALMVFMSVVMIFVRTRRT